MESESAATFSLTSGQTWDWLPGKVKPWGQYERDADQARVDAHKAEVKARREEPDLDVYDTESQPSSPSSFPAQEAHSLAREHKHIQEPIEGEMSSSGFRRLEGDRPAHYVAYCVFGGGEPVPTRDYAPKQDPTEPGSEGEDYEEGTLLIDLVDRASGHLLWSGSGVGNTRWGGDTGTDERARLRAVKEAFRHIMKDLK